MRLQTQAGEVSSRYDGYSAKATEATILFLSKPSSILFALAAGLYIAARLWVADYNFTNPDEFFSLGIVRRNWGGLMGGVVDDVVHPPLFYLLLKLWVGVGGESLAWLKLFPALVAIAAIVPFCLLCQELRLGRSEMNLALTLMAVNGYLVYYAQELRMYSLLLFFTLLSLWLFTRFLNHGANDPTKPLLALFVVNLLLIYTHYYGWLVIGVQFTLVLCGRDRRKMLPFLIQVGGLILCFIPWAYAVSQALARKGGLNKTLYAYPAPPPLRSLGYFYVVLSGPFYSSWKIYLGIVALVLFFSPILLLARRLLGGDRARGEEGDSSTKAFYWLSAFSFLPSLFAFVVSHVGPHSVWGHRHLIIVAAPYMLLVALAVERLGTKWVRTAAVLLILGCAASSGFKMRRMDQKYIGNHEFEARSLIAPPNALFASAGDPGRRRR